MVQTGKSHLKQDMLETRYVGYDKKNLHYFFTDNLFVLLALNDKEFKISIFY